MLNVILAANNFHCLLNIAEHYLREVEKNSWTRSPLSWIWKGGFAHRDGGRKSLLRKGEVLANI